MDVKEIDTKENNNNQDKNEKTEEINLEPKKDIDNEEDTNNDSKSLILAPYNSFISESNSDSEEKEEEPELDVLNEACIFESLAEQANINYEKKN